MTATAWFVVVVVVGLVGVPVGLAKLLAHRDRDQLEADVARLHSGPNLMTRALDDDTERAS